MEGGRTPHLPRRSNADLGDRESARQQGALREVEPWERRTDAVRPPTRTALLCQSILEADRLAVALALSRERLGPPLARAARAFVGQEAWLPFGYARLEDHARERLGRTGRWVRDLAALGEALERLPGIAGALCGADGAPPVGRVAALLIGRTASVESVGSWIALARSLPVREFKEEIKRARQSGSKSPLSESPRAPTRAERRDDSVFETRPANTMEPSCRESDPIEEGTSGRVPVAAGAEDDLSEDQTLVRILVPAAVRAAFDEGLDLHRAVSGQETTVTSFVEALVAESYAGAHPPDAEMVPLQSGLDIAFVEGSLARATDNWRHLGEDLAETEGPVRDGGFHEVLLQAAETLARIQEVSRRAGTGGARDLDEQLRTLIALEDEIDCRLGRLLAEMGDRGAWARLMFAGVGHYAEQRLGLSRTSAEDRAGLCRALRGLRLLRDAYECGKIGFEAALLVRRVLGRGPTDKEEEGAWVSHAEGVTIKRLRDEGRFVGRSVALETARTQVAPPDDAAWHASLARAPGTALSRIAALGKVAASGGLPDVFLRLRMPADLAAGFLAAIESRKRALSELVEQVHWCEPWPDPAAPGSVLAARTFSVRCRSVPAWAGLLALIEEYAGTWDDPAQAPRRAADAVYIRDGWRCAAPGCTSRQNLEEHHVVYRSRCGSHDLSNRTCACRFHHQMGEHGSLASCSGTAPLGIRWVLGRDGIGGRYRNERVVT